MRGRNKTWAGLALATLALLAAASCGGGGSAATTPGLAINLPSSPVGSEVQTTSGHETIFTQVTHGGGETTINTGGPTSSAYMPPIDIPAAESYQKNSSTGDSAGDGWLKNCYETLPSEDSDAGVFQNQSLQEWAYEIYTETNKARVENGLNELEYVPGLERLAQAHARDMALRDYFAHDCPDGVLMWDRWLAVKVPYTNWAGENAAKGQETVQEVIHGWLQSPGHRANMLSPEAQYTGVGVYFDPTDRDMPIHVITEYANFRDDPLAHEWYHRGDVYNAPTR